METSSTPRAGAPGPRRRAARLGSSGAFGAAAAEASTLSERTARSSTAPERRRSRRLLGLQDQRHRPAAMLLHARNARDERLVDQRLENLLDLEPKSSEVTEVRRRQMD